MTSIGKLRGLQRTTTREGFFTLCAIDHLSDFQILIDPDPSRVDYETTVAGKASIVRSLRDSVSGFLLDPRYSFAQAIQSGTVPGQTGLMVSLEEDGYLGANTERATRMREKWGVEKAKLAGADVVKLLWFYRPESAQASVQRELVQRLAEECERWDIALVVEPIWHPLDGEDVQTEQWQRDRVAGIVSSGRLAVELGADVLKTEFPGYLRGTGGVDLAREALREIDSSISVPWVLLSAGVGFDEFCDQVVEAGQAGSSGYLVGRSVWSDAVRAQGTENEQAEVDMARERLDKLSGLIAANGHPFLPTDAVSSVADGWYRDYASFAEIEAVR